MNSVSEKIKNECLDGMDFERILEIYNLYIDVNQPCDFHKLASSPIAASVSWNGKFLTAKLLRETADYDRVKDIRHRKKEALVEYKGGKCQICGYNRCIQALDFHHLNPAEKDFRLSSSSKSLDELKKEADKCILVCSNCHREIHAGLKILN